MFVTSALKRCGFTYIVAGQRRSLVSVPLKCSFIHCVFNADILQLVFFFLELLYL